MTIDHEKMEALAELYEKTGEDWDLLVHHCLTEPTCPNAVVQRFGGNSVRYRADRDTLEEAINAAVDMAYRELILGERIESECPFTNPDDH